MPDGYTIEEHYQLKIGLKRENLDMSLFGSILRDGDGNKLIRFPFNSSLRGIKGVYPAAYVIRNNKGSFYIGCTGNIKNRINQHRGYLRKGTHVNERLQDMYNNITEDRLTIYIYPCKTKKQAVNIENSILKANYTSGTCLNIRGTEKELESERLIKLREWCKSEEGRKIRSVIAKNNWRNEEFRDKFLSKVGESIVVDGITYRSVREASRLTGYSINALRNSLKDGIVNTTDIRPFKRQVSAMGIIYESVNAAGIAHGIRDNTMHYRLNSDNPKWKDFFYITT